MQITPIVHRHHNCGQAPHAGICRTGAKLTVGFFAVLLVAASLCSCTPSDGSREPPAAAVKLTALGIKEVSPQELKDWMAAGKQFTLIDVREDNEWQEGHAAAALHIPRWTLSGRIASVVPDQAACVVLYCRSGVRSAAAAVALQNLGYRNVFSLAGGFVRYQLAGLPAQQ